MTTPRDVIGSSIYMAALAASQGNCKCQTCKIMRKAAPALLEMYFEKPPKNDPANPSASKPEEVVDVPE
jgi:hypothetical protein